MVVVVDGSLVEVGGLVVVVVVDDVGFDSGVRTAISVDESRLSITSAVDAPRRRSTVMAAAV